MAKAKTNVIKFSAASAAKREDTRAQRFARVEEHLGLLELNEFNFVAPSESELELLAPGRAWWHKVASCFGMPRLPTTEAELLGTQQALMFLVMASRPTPWADQDADWLAAGRATLEESMPWAAAWFEAYLQQDVTAMRDAAESEAFMDEAATEWLDTRAAQSTEERA